MLTLLISLANTVESKSHNRHRQNVHVQSFDVVSKCLLIDISVSTYWTFELLDLSVGGHVATQLGSARAAFAAMWAIVLVDAVVQFLVEVASLERGERFVTLGASMRSCLAGLMACPGQVIARHCHGRI